MHNLPNFTNPFDIDLLWNTIKSKYEYNGQCLDHDLSMATMSTLNFNIQIHGQNKNLLNIENRIVILKKTMLVKLIIQCRIYKILMYYKL